jgi:hypothetical protein
MRIAEEGEGEGEEKRGNEADVESGAKSFK